MFLEILQGFHTILELAVRILLRVLSVYSGFRMLHFTCVQGNKSDAARRAASDLYRLQTVKGVYYSTIGRPTLCHESAAPASEILLLHSLNSQNALSILKAICCGEDSMH